MVRPQLRSLTRLALLIVLGAAFDHAPASAQGLQSGRMVFEAVAAVTTSSEAVDDPFVFLDLATTVRVNDKLDVIVRPWARRLPGGDWDLLFYQAQIRYQPAERVRLDAGIISSPLGLGTLELRQDLNPLVGSPFYYFGRLPLFDRQSDRVQILAGGYPIGAVLSASGSWWDARTGITDGTPGPLPQDFRAQQPGPGGAVHRGRRRHAGARSPVWRRVRARPLSARVRHRLLRPARDGCARRRQRHRFQSRG